MGQLRFEPAEKGARLHFFPLLDGPLQVVDELLLLLDQLGRQAGEPRPHAAIGPGAVQTIELLGRLLQPLVQRGDELLFLGQLGFERIDAYLHVRACSPLRAPRDPYPFSVPIALFRFIPVRLESIPGQPSQNGNTIA